jgi:hypothetical protein
MPWRGLSLDLEQASDSGFDTFRLRAGLWLKLPKKELAHHLDFLKRAVNGEIARLRIYAKGQDEIESAELDLVFRLDELRLRWINEQRDALRRPARPRSARPTNVRGSFTDYVGKMGSPLPLTV